MADGMMARVARFDSLFRNALTRLGTQRARAQQNKVGRQADRFTQITLDELYRSKFVRIFAEELARDAATDVTLAIDGKPMPEMEETLDRLNFSASMVEASSLARHYGGAALWVVCDGGGPVHMPLEAGSVRRVTALIPITRFELSPTTSYERKAERIYHETNTILDGDPSSPGYGKPRAYIYHPATGGGGGTVIHASRLIRFYGDTVPPHLLPYYDYWGAPAIEGIWQSLSNLKMGQNAASEILQEFGHMVYTLPNLLELMSGSKRDELSEWMDIQAEGKSVLRGTLLGPGQDAKRPGFNLSGWKDVYNALAEAVAADGRIPITKLYGQSPGGLSTDDASAWRNWSRQTANHQTLVYEPAYQQICYLLASSMEGPTGGRMPRMMTFSFEPYEVPTPKEEADTASVWSTAVNALSLADVISRAEARDTLRGVRGFRLEEEPSAELDAGEHEPEVEEALAMMESAAAAARQLRFDAESFTPPLGVQRRAALALRTREGKPPSERGMTPTGIARARDLSNGRPVSEGTLRRMLSYFDRHRGDKDGETWGSQGKGWQAWNGWGGDPGERWARSIIEGIERREDAAAALPYTGIHDGTLPARVLALSEAKRRRWLAVYNGTLEALGDEGLAAEAANHLFAMRADAAEEELHAALNAFFSEHAAALPPGSVREETPTDAMIAIYPPPGWTEPLAGHSEEPLEELHVTLIYIPEILESELPAWRAAISRWCRDWGELRGRAALDIKVNGVGQFNNERDVRILLMGGLYLSEMREDLKRHLIRAGLLSMAGQNHGFIPHMTLGYYEPGQIPTERVRFSSLPPFTASSVALVCEGSRSIFSFADAEAAIIRADAGEEA